MLNAKYQIPNTKYQIPNTKYQVPNTTFDANLSRKSKLERLQVVLVRTRNPLNIGAAARAMSNFGFQHLRVVKPYEAAFREARSAVGAADVLASAQEFGTVAEAIADCTLIVGTSAMRDREVQHAVRPLEDGAALIRQKMKTGGVALLFGSEKVGLSTSDLSHCHFIMRIPTREEHGSMNLGQAVAVCLYEVRRQLLGARQKSLGRIPANAGEMELLTDVLLDVLRVSGYMKPRASAATEEKIRRMVRRLEIQEQDARVLLGMLRQVKWKMK